MKDNNPMSILIDLCNYIHIHHASQCLYISICEKDNYIFHRYHLSLLHLKYCFDKKSELNSQKNNKIRMDHLVYQIQIC